MLSNETSLTWPHETISATENHRKQSEGGTGGDVREEGRAIQCMMLKVIIGEEIREEERGREGKSRNEGYRPLDRRQLLACIPLRGL